MSNPYRNPFDRFVTATKYLNDSSILWQRVKLLTANVSTSSIGGGGPNIVILQSKFGGWVDVASQPITLDNPVTEGSLLVFARVWWAGVNSEPITSISDSVGNSWSLARSQTRTTQDGAEIWYATNAFSGTTSVSAATETGFEMAGLQMIYELSGITQMDYVANTGSGVVANTNPVYVSAGATTVSANNFVVIAHCYMAPDATDVGCDNNFITDIFGPDSTTANIAIYSKISTTAALETGRMDLEIPGAASYSIVSIAAFSTT